MDGSHAVAGTPLDHPRFQEMPHLGAWHRALQVVIGTEATLISMGFGGVCADMILRRKSRADELLEVSRL